MRGRVSRKEGDACGTSVVLEEATWLDGQCAKSDKCKVRELRPMCCEHHFIICFTQVLFNSASLIDLR